MRLHVGCFVGVLLSSSAAASAQVLPLAFPPEEGPLEALAAPGVPLEAPLSLALAAVPLPEAPPALSVEPLWAADNEGVDPNGFKSSAAELARTLETIRQDGWNGRGPGSYRLPGVTHIYVDKSGGLPTFYVNSQPVGYLDGSSPAAAAKLKDALKAGGHAPRAVLLEGRYADTTFYIDRVRFGD